MESKHTKGKFNDGFNGWRIGERTTNGTKGFEIHYSDDGECITDHVYEEANAKLISKAPEMLEALKYVLSVIENSDEWWINCPDKGGFDVDKIVSVIKQATEQ